MVLILTANQQPIVKMKGGYRPWINQMVAQRWAGFKIVWEGRGQVAAEIVRSSWRVSCPFCRGAVVIELDELFFCPDCLMQANAFHPMNIIIPRDFQEIERLLLKRPDPQRRNWLAYETVDDIRRENLAHGVEV